MTSDCGEEPSLAVITPTDEEKGSALPAIAAKADDVEEIKKSVEDAAAVSGGLWLSYLFVLFYIAIAAGAVTHEDLLLVRAVKLPFLNVELPLKAFFALAPFVVLIIHAYALMHFIMLGKKASRFHNELRRQFPDRQSEKSTAAPEGAHKEIRDKLRRLLPSNIFVQVLAGPPELRSGIFGAMLKLIALTTLVVFPILLLLLLQIQFLPFHDWKITDAQRAALVVDIVLLWLLRPPILADLSVEISGRARPRTGPARLRPWPRGGHEHPGLWFSVVVATIPGEWPETALARLDRSQWRFADVAVVSTHDFLFAGEKLGWKEHLFDLRGRRLEQAVFDGADLTKADLTGAQLQGASLHGAAVNAADFSLTFLWRTNWRETDPAELGAVRLKDVTWKPVSRPAVPLKNFLDSGPDPVPWDARAYAELRDSMSSIPEGKRRGDALMRIEILECENPDKRLASCDPTAEPPPQVLNWQKKLLEANVDHAAFAKALSQEMRGLVCANDANAIHILHGTMTSNRLADTGREAPALVDFIMSKDCPVSAALSDDDKAKLLKSRQDAEQLSGPSKASKKES